jgi:hypothetical protein
MKTKICQIITLLLVLFICSNVFATKNILFVGKGEGDENILADNLLVAQIENIGYIVTFVDAATFGGATYSTADGYSGYDAIFISESVGSGTVVNYKTAGFPIPCVTTEGYAPRTGRWDLLTDNDLQFKQLSGAEKDVDGLSLIIEDDDHYITEYYGINDQVDWSTNEAGVSNIGPTGFKIDENIPTAIYLATNKNSVLTEFPSLWAIPQGAALMSDTVTLPRIVILGIVIPGLGEFATTDFYEIITRALEWATGDVESGINKVALDKYNVKIIPDPASQLVNILFELQEKSMVRLHIYDLMGRVVKSIPAENYNQGLNEISLDLSPAADAFYIYEFNINDERFTGKINIVK